MRLPDPNSSQELEPEPADERIKKVFGLKKERILQISFGYQRGESHAVW